jgi:hypothetical protein
MFVFYAQRQTPGAHLLAEDAVPKGAAKLISAMVL